jgi:hypothetical protein
MLHDRPGGDVAQPLTPQTESLDHAAQRSRQHFLIAHLCVSAVAARKRNAHAADDRDTAWTGSDQHKADSRLMNRRDYEPNARHIIHQ